MSKPAGEGEYIFSNVGCQVGPVACISELSDTSLNKRDSLTSKECITPLRVLPLQRCEKICLDVHRVYLYM